MGWPGKIIRLASIQHVYRRGHIFWWRRVHSLFNDFRLDVRLSLKTASRPEARNRGAALTASTGSVLAMLNDHVREADQMPTEAEIQAMARSIYEKVLAQTCAQQREEPGLADLHAVGNLAYIDFYHRMTRHGGHMTLLPGEEARLRGEGWDDDRVNDLRGTITLYEDGKSPLRDADIDHALTSAGFPQDERLRHMVRVACFPHLREAFIDAQVSLETMLDVNPWVSSDDAVAPSLAPTAAAAAATAVADTIPARWRTTTPTQAAEMYIAETPRLLEHRRSGKRNAEQVGEQTLRQIRWAATLLQKSLPAGTPLWKVTKADIVELDRMFDQLSIHFGKSPRDQGPAVTLRVAADRAADMLEEGKLKSEDLGFSNGTANKHFNKLGQIHAFMLADDDMQATSVRAIDFSKFTVAENTDEREARQRYTVEQGEAIFRLAPWTGCAGLSDRLSPGRNIFHDALFFVLLLVWYTGARREELCKLMLDDIEQRDGFHYLLIRPTETGRVKNIASRRVIVICDELIRLGFVRYVEAMRAAGETLLFPEIAPARANGKFGDVFYKLWWLYIKPLVPGLQRGQAMHAARHMVSDELKQKQVFVESRNDLLGHKGKGGDGETRYPSRASLELLSGLVEQIPIVTSHLPDQRVIKLLPAAMRVPRPTRGTGVNDKK